DETITIGHDRKETVGNDEQVNIGQDRRHEIGRDDFLTVGRNHTIYTTKDRTEEVGNNRRDKTAANHWVSIGGHQEHTVEGRSELQAGEAILQRTKVYEVQAAESLTLKGPGGTIRIDGSGITLEGIAIVIKGPMSQKGGGGGNTLALSGVAFEGLDADCAERNR
ncbi:bacteriophage T4 gp5 trimerisation domain-containing protein, partial [Achromobacter animicus]|uniref:bacteriophage T4 gp5 trimerisation domain-containing protein n=1 Tax=Achromobacter animicus TaxID=1389935 RepID=UPI003917D52C